MKITYGTDNCNIDVTEICYTKLMKNNIISIPCGDIQRAYFFTDPIFGQVKSIFIKNKNNITSKHNHTKKVIINIITETITIITNEDINKKLSNIQSSLRIKYGSFNEELPEQKMVCRYIRGYEKVLEIGSNIGRNSLIIAHILGKKNNNNFVTLECDSAITQQLQENSKINNFNFHIQNSALSKRKLIQKGWDTIPSDVLLDGYKNVNTITLDRLESKYNIKFDTLVLDCEGAFYYILMDMPEILQNINLIIMENDYSDINKKQYVDQVLKNNNFYVDYSESGGWGPCASNFFEVWKK
jgi:FkbM family methyltransferase